MWAAWFGPAVAAAILEVRLERSFEWSSSLVDFVVGNCCCCSWLSCHCVAPLGFPYGARVASALRWTVFGWVVCCSGLQCRSSLTRVWSDAMAHSMPVLVVEAYYFKWSKPQVQLHCFAGKGPQKRPPLWCLLEVSCLRSLSMQVLLIKHEEHWEYQ